MKYSLWESACLKKATGFIEKFSYFDFIPIGYELIITSAFNLQHPP